MKFAKHVSNFEVDKATYFMNDTNGNTILLKLNYLGNSYRLKPITKTENGYTKLVKEAKRVSRELLLRKAQKNLAEE